MAFDSQFSQNKKQAIIEFKQYFEKGANGECLVKVIVKDLTPYLVQENNNDAIEIIGVFRR